jgi:hypothetical protein
MVFLLGIEEAHTMTHMCAGLLFDRILDILRHN